ncbi:alkaline phosphatase family protein [Puniceicoccales bacterium CK1056]|uniref:Alkaline phosphatase family protein n=1 Tax=Oceanipulchritudo coccoides TaxID=2706888 RepID=A0A6B2LYT4_9BACT|nr:alkaline phosphatase D family protein [Oceanipulchritudo coccoides]NDV61216.1 alkaline phosphatase family protein [Oceanipulchritudo coccoides]
MSRLFLVVAMCCQVPFLSAAKLQSGPMIGYATMAEVLVWVQTDAAAEVKVAYWPEDDPDSIRFTDTIQTRKQDGFIAKCIADTVAEGTQYGYALYIDGDKVEPRFREEYREGTIPLTFSTPPNWRFRKDGHTPFDFTIGFGSCAYINEREGGYDRMNSKPYGDGYEIFESIYEVNPDAFVWLGDNIYYREPDWTSRTGMIHRWTHDRSIPHLRPMLATIPQYATWDDHDYGPNDAGREFWNKGMAKEIFSLFNGNPSAGVPGIPGIFTYFAWGDVHFYLLDNRTHRTTPGLALGQFGYPPQQLGKAQIDWLIESMKYNRMQSRSSYPSTFNIIGIGSQIFSPHSKDGLQRYPEEWQYLIDRLIAEELHNTIFISGDVHFSEASRLVVEESNFTVTEFTSSPLTAGPWPGSPAKNNPYRLDIFPGEADRYGERNFATLTFEGPLWERRVVVRYYDTNGELINQDPDKAPGEPTGESIIEVHNPNLDPRLRR